VYAGRTVTSAEAYGLGGVRGACAHVGSVAAAQSSCRLHTTCLTVPGDEVAVVLWLCYCIAGVNKVVSVQLSPR